MHFAKKYKQLTTETTSKTGLPCQQLEKHILVMHMIARKSSKGLIQAMFIEASSSIPQRLKVSASFLGSSAFGFLLSLQI